MTASAERSRLVGYLLEAERLRKHWGLNQSAVGAEPNSPSQGSSDSPVTASHISQRNSTYAPECVYTILHSRDLANFFRNGRCGTFVEGKKWVSAQRLLHAAQSAGQIVPVVFAPGEDIRELTHFAELNAVTITQVGGEWATTVKVANLTKIPAPHPMKTELTVCSTGKRLPMGHIKPYVLVYTPKFLFNK